MNIQEQMVGVLLLLGMLISSSSCYWGLPQRPTPTVNDCKDDDSFCRRNGIVNLLSAHVPHLFRDKPLLIFIFLGGSSMNEVSDTPLTGKDIDSINGLSHTLITKQIRVY